MPWKRAVNSIVLLLPKLFVLNIKTKLIQNINKKLKILTNKKNIILTSQLRVGFILVLKYLKQKYPKKKESKENSNSM